MFLNPDRAGRSDRSGRDPVTKAGRFIGFGRFNIRPVVGPVAGRSGRSCVLGRTGHNSCRFVCVK
ncbi:hypothetical protein HanPI659440_Chr06g0242651 [Helianthus annuus]|nr:hypothetical protein HanPI659440_Chr06g0242651 [Helianthus annuus]